MSQVHLSCGLPFCQNPKDIQTNLSIGLRITAVVLGTLAVIVGALVLLNIPGLSHLGTTVGWTLVSIGTFLALVGISIKCVKDKSQIEEKEATQDDTLESNVDKSDFNKENIEGREVQKENKTNEPVKPLQDKKKKTVSSKHSIISKKQAPKELISKLPQWLSSCVTDVPYLKLQDK